MQKQYSLAIHGGAGTIHKSKITPQKEMLYKEVLQNSLLSGNKMLEE